jgi:predicted ABC-class ATPase
MSKKRPDPTGRQRTGVRPTLSARLETVRYLNDIKSRSSQRRTVPIQAIAEALVAAGYTSLDQQAKALGIHRSTAWTIIKTRHKLGRLNRQTAQRILDNPDTPPSVRAIVQQALVEI